MGYAALTIRKIAGPEAKGDGVRAASRVLGLPASTVSRWKSVGHIPSNRHALVRDKAAAAGVELGPEDFFDGKGSVNGPVKASKPAESQQVGAPKLAGAAA